MGNAPLGPTQTQLNVAVLTPLFQIRGRLTVIGIFQTFLEDEQRPGISLQGTSVLGLNMGNPAAQMSQAEMFIVKREAHIIALEGVPPAGAITLPPRAESLIAYTPHFAIMGKFHMGADASLLDFVGSARSMYLPVSECRFYPMFQARPGIVGGASLALVHRSAIVTYHRA